MTASQYRTVVLPKSLSKLLARRYAALNVEAIRAIKSRILLYAPQFLRTTESWEEELKQPNYYCHVLVAPNINSGSTSLEEGQWVGMCWIKGPLDEEAYNFFHLDKLGARAEEAESRWLGGRLYVKEEHRNIDAIRQLSQSMANAVEQDCVARYGQNPGKKILARLQFFAYYGTTAHQYYSASGGRVLGELTRKQNLEYEGYAKDVPEEFWQDEDDTELNNTVFEMTHTFTM